MFNRKALAVATGSLIIGAAGVLGVTVRADGDRLRLDEPDPVIGEDLADDGAVPSSSPTKTGRSVRVEI